MGGCTSNTSKETSPDSVAKVQNGIVVQIYGVYASMNCMGPLLLAKEHTQCTLVPIQPRDGTQSDEFKKINPFAGVPCMKHGEYVLGESGAILRYLAEKCCPAAYPKEPKRRAFIDWALDRFATAMYQDGVNTIYPILELAGAPAVTKEAATRCNDNLESWASCFLKEKFVGGSQLSIADYKIAPWLVMYAHPAVRNVGVNMPGRMNQFLEHFMAACPSSKWLLEADGKSLKEMLDSKLEQGKSKDLVLTPVSGPQTTEDILKSKISTGNDIEVCGVYGSVNCMGPLLLATSQSLGKLKEAVPFQDTMSKEFIEINPFQMVPAMKDGGFACGESNAILRYLGGVAKDRNLFPADSLQKRGFINWAMDRFSTGMYSDVLNCIYPVLGYAPAPANRQAAAKKCHENLESFAEVFLKDTKFIGGEHLSIADFKVAPFFYCYEHGAVSKQSYITIPKRIKQFNEDFKAQSGTCFNGLENESGSLGQLLNAKRQGWKQL